MITKNPNWMFKKVLVQLCLKKTHTISTVQYQDSGVLIVSIFHVDNHDIKLVIPH